jgi:hypothetical protein
MVLGLAATIEALVSQAVSVRHLLTISTPPPGSPRFG